MLYHLQVQVVQEKSTKEVYAMKIMKKAHILQQADVSIWKKLTFEDCCNNIIHVLPTIHLLRLKKCKP